jgi:methyl-accepting chemotaxis protein
MNPPPDTEHGLMDSEHRAVLDWAQEAAARLQHGHPLEDCLYAIDVLVHLARSHFQHELVEMRAKGYPSCRAHGQDHERLLADLTQLRKGLVTAGADGADAVRRSSQERLANWMLSHIAGHDRHYALWLRQRAHLAAGTPGPTQAGLDGHRAG